MKTIDKMVALDDSIKDQRNKEAVWGPFTHGEKANKGTNIEEILLKAVCRCFDTSMPLFPFHLFCKLIFLTNMQALTMLRSSLVFLKIPICQK